MSKKNIYLEKIAAFFDLNALAGNSDDVSVEKSDVEKAKELKKTIAERQARNKAHFESAMRSHQHLKSQSAAAEAARAGAETSPSAILGNHIHDSVLDAHDLHESYGPGEIHGPRGVSTKMTNKAEKITSLLSKHKGKLAIAGGVAALGAAGLAASHEKAASNAFSRNIAKSFSAAAARGESGAHMMALREAKNLPASSAKSEALQKAMRSGGGDSARHVTGNPKVNREISDIKDIGNTNRALDSFKQKTGFKSLEGDRHLGILERVNAIKNAG